jgi:hypothetical protein
MTYYVVDRDVDRVDALFKVEHAVAAPGALIGASNFFQLAVATAIALFGPESRAALATVAGLLIEVPVRLSVCSVRNRTRHWFPAVAIRRERETGLTVVAKAASSASWPTCKARALSAGTAPVDRGASGGSRSDRDGARNADDGRSDSQMR